MGFKTKNWSHLEEDKTVERERGERKREKKKMKKIRRREENKREEEAKPKRYGTTWNSKVL